MNKEKYRIKRIQSIHQDYFMIEYFDDFKKTWAEIDYEKSFLDTYYTALSFLRNFIAKRKTPLIWYFDENGDEIKNERYDYDKFESFY